MENSPPTQRYPDSISASERKPSWLKTQIPSGLRYYEMKRDLHEQGLHTVCELANCPNITECWNKKTSTLMILGSICTRHCRFCGVKTGDPQGFIDGEEPASVAGSIKALALEYVVITMVDRDDLADGGASHIRRVIETVYAVNPGIKVEFLGGDFSGKEDSLQEILAARPEVFAHNIETVERLTPSIRDRRAGYQSSLLVLSKIKELAAYPIFTKSSIMLGLGESRDEVITSLRDLRRHDVDFVTMGQYLRPGPKNARLYDYISPRQFTELGEIALEMGFHSVASAPLVRSSYQAKSFFDSREAAISSKNRG